MIFSSSIFLFLFLPTILVFYFLSPKKIKNLVLLIASLFFYAWGEMQYIWVLLISIIGNYFFGILIGKFLDEKKSINLKLVISAAIIFNLSLLGYYKYANFLIDNLNHLLNLGIIYHKVHLPIGISFFTFHSISYIVDIYRKKVVPQKNIFDLALYISLFPQLVAGPIVRYNAIVNYLDGSKRRHNWFIAAYGIRRFIIGLGKKVILANPLGEIADAVFALPVNDISTSLAWMGIFCYSLQIFYDFSGYSDMAIGLARIFGFKFTENFNYPYISRSIKEFWRRWHISLSTWFRDYLYIPLGGNKCGIYRQYFNLILVFFLCGFWHGASWSFVVWGLFHGSFLVLERTKFGDLIQKLPGAMGNFYAILVVTLSWVFFRSPDLTYAVSYLHSMFGGAEVATISGEIGKLINSHFNKMIMVIAILMIAPVSTIITKKLSLKKLIIFSYLRDFWLIFVLIVILIRLAAGTHNPFIYFQF